MEKIILNNHKLYRNRSKTWRKTPYFRSERFDSSCRPGGSCPYCQRRREYRNLKLAEKAAHELREAGFPI